VEGTAGYDPPPANYQEFIQRRVYFDPDPNTSEDLSLASYISSISYGRAIIDATIAEPVTLRNLANDQNPTLLAINAQPDAHEYEYLAVVYPPNRRGAGSGMSQPGQIQFTPPREPNRTKARSRFPYDAPIGTWAMEVLHNVTQIGDYYNGVSHPGRFDEMADSAATHPCSYTKLEAGWLDPGNVPADPGLARTYTLHAIGLPQPPPAGRVAGIRIQAFGSDRYLIVEARLKSDRWERGVTGSPGFPGIPGIPSEGVVVYEFAPESDPWPRLEPNGPWPPLQLRTPTALTAGQSFRHQETLTTVTVESAAVGGFTVEIATGNVAVPAVQELPEAAAATRIRTAGLRPEFTGMQGPQAWVWRQSPPPGIGVPTGSVVTLQLRTGPIP
jgi:hypothetical protein